MEVKLNQIAQKAKRDKRFKFTSLVHHVNEDNLALCYRELKRNKACGIDGVTVEAYGGDLQGNLKRLVEAMKSKSYRPKPVRRVYIPKAGKAEKRGLGIPSVEDKLVQIMLKKVLESIFEADFLDSSYGFRPSRSCHDAVKALDTSVMTKPVNFIVEVDIKGFFDNVSHYWLQRCLEERIVRFGRNAWKLATKHQEKVGSFTFLGFTHYCAKSRRGKFIMGHKTSKENLRRKLKEVKEWLKAIRNLLRLKDWWPVLKAKLTGHYNYFGVSGNYRCIARFYEQVKLLVFKWINRRSQKKSMNFERYLNYLQFNPLPEPRICQTLYTLSPKR